MSDAVLDRIYALARGCAYVLVVLFTLSCAATIVVPICLALYALWSVIA